MDHDFLILIAAMIGVVGLLVILRSGVSLLTISLAVMPFPLALGGEGGAGNVAAADAVVGACLLTLLSRSQLRLGGAGQAVVAFLAVATCSSLLSTPPAETALGLGRMALVTVVPLLVFANAADPLRQLRRGLTAYCLACVVLAGFSAVAFATGGAQASMYTLGIHKNSLGPIFGSAVVVTFAAITMGAFRERRLITVAYGVLGGACVGLLLCLSRGGWVGTMAGLLVVMGLTGRVKPAIIGTVLFAPVLAGIWSLLPAERVDYATNVSTDSYVLRTRIDAIGRALEAFQSSPILGVGVGLERHVDPHNVVILALGETGIVGVIAFTAMVAIGAGTLFKAMRRFPPGDPDRVLMVAGLAAFAVYHVQTLIDVYWRRGVGGMSWACVGTAVAVLAGAGRIEPKGLPPVPPQARRRPRAKFPAPQPQT